jgi:hypothetical protein
VILAIFRLIGAIFFAVVVNGTLTGCAAIDMHAPSPSDWPDLMPVEHYVPHAEMRDRCSRYVGPFSSPEACAEIHFVERRCDMWFSADMPPSRYVIEHERQHCQGYDHINDSTLRDAWENHKRTKL